MKLFCSICGMKKQSIFSVILNPVLIFCKQTPVKKFLRNFLISSQKQKMIILPKQTPVNSIFRITENNFEMVF